jgi:co-chaperonin GroES (HSP10)
MVDSKYLEAFKKAKQEAGETYKLYGDAILVERVPEEEIKTASGLVLAPSSAKQINSISADRPHFVHVIAVGEGFYNEETGQDVPLSVEPGDIILVGVNSVKWFSFMEIANYEPGAIGLTRESEIQLKFKGQEAYRKYFDTINSGLKK